MANLYLVPAFFWGCEGMPVDSDGYPYQSIALMFFTNNGHKEMRPKNKRAKHLVMVCQDVKMDFWILSPPLTIRDDEITQILCKNQKISWPNIDDFRPTPTLVTGFRGQVTCPNLSWPLSGWSWILHPWWMILWFIDIRWYLLISRQHALFLVICTEKLPISATCKMIMIS